MDRAVGDGGRGFKILGSAGRGLVVCVSKAGAPVAEIGTYDEEVRRVGEVRSKEPTQGALGVRSSVTYHNRYQEREVVRLEIPSPCVNLKR